MVVIRLARSGSKGRPFFNVVVADKRSRRDGRFIERIGFFNPNVPQEKDGLRIAAERLQHWVSNGAQVSDCVKKLAKRLK